MIIISSHNLFYRVNVSVQSFILLIIVVIYLINNYSVPGPFPLFLLIEQYKYLYEYSYQYSTRSCSYMMNSSEDTTAPGLPESIWGGKSNKFILVYCFSCLLLVK